MYNDSDYDGSDYYDGGDYYDNDDYPDNDDFPDNDDYTDFDDPHDNYSYADNDSPNNGVIAEDNFPDSNGHADNDDFPNNGGIADDDSPDNGNYYDNEDFPPNGHYADHDDFPNNDDFPGTDISDNDSSDDSSTSEDDYFFPNATPRLIVFLPNPISAPESANATSSSIATAGPTRNRADTDKVPAKLKHLDLTGSVEYHSPKRPVARGGFGDVYRGFCRLPDGSRKEVAVKSLTVYLDGSRDTAKIFKREIEAWSKLTHPNVLSLLGYTLEEMGEQAVPSLVSEWVDNGNILDFVTHNPNHDIARLTLDVASGLAYLHTMNIVHSDVKSANVLVSSTENAVICDFGASHISRNLNSLSKSSDVTGLRGTSRWLAYELLAHSHQYPAATKSSDVWAFGMTVYELMTHKIPYAHFTIEAQVILAIVNRMLPLPPENLHKHPRAELWTLCNACWDFDVDRRPTMDRVIDLIRAFGESSVIERLLKECPGLELDLELTASDLHSSQHNNAEGTFQYLSGSDHKGSVITIRRPVESNIWSSHESAYDDLDEIRLLSKIPPHPNVQDFLGYIMDTKTSRLSLVFHPAGTRELLDYVKRNQQSSFSKILLEISRALDFLHGHDFVHESLSMSKIFAKDDGSPVISIDCAVNRKNLKRRPENELNALERGKFENVASFGTIIFELVFWNLPSSDSAVDLKEACSSGQTYPANLRSRPEGHKIFWRVCQQCWNKNDSLRPSMSQLATKLEHFLEFQNDMS